MLAWNAVSWGQKAGTGQNPRPSEPSLASVHGTGWRRGDTGALAAASAPCPGEMPLIGEVGRRVRGNSLYSLCHISVNLFFKNYFFVVVAQVLKSNIAQEHRTRRSRAVGASAGCTCSGRADQSRPSPSLLAASRAHRKPCASSIFIRSVRRSFSSAASRRACVPAVPLPQGAPHGKVSLGRQLRRRSRGSPEEGVSGVRTTGLVSQWGSGGVGSPFLPAVLRGATESGLKAN